MNIISYEEKYKNQVIALILYLQNFDNKVDLSLNEQNDLCDISKYYVKNGGGFWLAINSSDDVVGTLGLMKKSGQYGILKKFFVNPDYRGKKKGVSSKLYNCLVDHAKANGITCIILDTPSKCTRAHNFYVKKGYQQIEQNDLPIHYDFPDRNSYFFIRYL